MNYKKIAAATALISVGILAVAAKPDKRTAKKIESVMKRMSKPEKALKKLERSKLYTGTDFKRNILLLARESKAMLKVKHPEADFNEISQQLDDDLKKVIAAITKKDYKAIEKGWKTVKKTCYECHDSYKED